MSAWRGIAKSCMMNKLTVESQDPVHKLIPSLLTPKQLTSVFMAIQITNTITSEDIPDLRTGVSLIVHSIFSACSVLTDLALVIVVASKQQASRYGKCD